MAQAALDSTLLWALFVVVGFAVFIVGVLAAVSAPQSADTSDADAARLDELEPLPHSPDDERGPR